MKKLLIFLLAALVHAAAVQAQDAPQASKDTLTEEQIIKKADEMTEMMRKRYGLDDAQVEGVKRLNRYQQKLMARIEKAIDLDIADSEQMAEYKETMQLAEEQYNEQLKDMLSPKQYEKFSEDAKKLKAAKEAMENAKEIAPWPVMAPGRDFANLLGWGPKLADSTAIATKETERLVKKFKLNQEQAARLQEINMDEVRAEFDERRTNAKQGFDMGSAQERLDAAQERTDNYFKALQTVLTPAQYKKYTNARKAEAAQHGGFPGRPMMMMRRGWW